MLMDGFGAVRTTSGERPSAGIRRPRTRLGRTAAYRNQRKLDNSLKQIRFLIHNKLGLAPGLGFSFSLLPDEIG